ncbi:MAG TPA: TonB-dependent receptor [Woeseiaceae bacterium]|nr:TonB-dependent receptor [Woeseiaceae bacterium]
MRSNRAIRIAVRQALFAGALASAAAYAPLAVAQDSDEDTIEEITVTGSRIVRRDFESASPIATVDAELFEQTAAITVESVLNTLPQFVPAITSSSNNPSNGGQANVSLRGLGTERTLILVDGRRVVPSNATGVVDLNILPASLISNVEIITGGASAVYGSDAVGGVVNFKLKEFTGLEVSGGWGQTGEADGAQTSGSITGGMEFAGGRGHVMGSVSYVDRDAVYHGDRDFSRDALGYDAVNGVFESSGSATIPQGRFDTTTSNLPTVAAIDSVFAGYGVAAGSVGQGSNFGFNEDGTIFSIAPVYNFTGDQALLTNPDSFNYNFAPVNALQLPLDRTSFFGKASFDINDSVEVYAQMLYTDYSVFSQLAASPATGLSVPVTNPNIPADLLTILNSRPDPNANFTFRRRMLESGERSRTTDYTVQQYTVGLTGDLAAEWTFDVFASYGDVDITETQGGNLSEMAFQDLLEAPDGGQALCGGFNPFGLNQISDECAQYLAVDAKNFRGGRMRNMEANVQGPIASLPAGDVMLAGGIAYKSDTFFESYDDVLRTGDVIGFNANDNIDAQTDVSEIYAEALIPLVSDKPGIQNLEATLGYRLSDYSTAGTVESYKAEGIYSINDTFTLRGSYQRAVRAPSIFELFQPIVQNFPGIDEDPCSNDSDARAGANGAQVEQLCVAQGIPANALPVYNYANQQVAGGLAGGNPNLTEETADTYSFGVVFQSPFQGAFGDLQASLDFYQIEIKDAIAVVDAATFVSRCYDAQYNPNFSPDNVFCGFFRRDPSTSEIIDASELNENLAAFKTAGIDLQVDWGTDVGPGALGVSWIATYLTKWDRQALPGDPFEDLVGTIGNTSISSVGIARPEWKWTLNSDYVFGNIGLNARWRYIDSMRDNSVDTFKTDAVHYFDIGATYDFKDVLGGKLNGLSGRLGVTNLTDEQPEIFPSSSQANTDPSTYDTLGRRYFVNLTYTFE